MFQMFIRYFQGDSFKGLETQGVQVDSGGIEPPTYQCE